MSRLLYRLHICFNNPSHGLEVSKCPIIRIFQIIRRFRDRSLILILNILCQGIRILGKLPLAVHPVVYTLESSLETCSITKRKASDKLEESVNFEDIRVVPATGTNCRNSTFLDEGLGVWRCPSFGRALFGATVEWCPIRGLKGLG